MLVIDHVSDYCITDVTARAAAMEVWMWDVTEVTPPTLPSPEPSPAGPTPMVTAAAATLATSSQALVLGLVGQLLCDDFITQQLSESIDFMCLVLEALGHRTSMYINLLVLKILEMPVGCGARDRVG